jgi:glycerophosphoryl diester phosphodiesterase
MSWTTSVFERCCDVVLRVAGAASAVPSPAVAGLALGLTLAGCASTGPPPPGAPLPGYPGGTAALASCLRAPSCNDTLVVAHRGSGTWSRDENSVAAGLQVVAAGIPIMETDVRASRDGEMFLMHDATVDRRTSGEGKLADLDAAQLEQLQLRNGELVPALRDVYAVTRGEAILLLDFKTRDALETAADWIAREASFDDFVFLVNRRSEMSVAASLKSRYPALIVMASATDEAKLDDVRRAFGGRLPELIGAHRPSSRLVAMVHAEGAKISANLLGYERVPIYGSLLTRLMLDRGVDLLQTDRARQLWSYVRKRNESEAAAADGGALGR